MKIALGIAVLLALAAILWSIDLRSQVTALREEMAGKDLEQGPPGGPTPTVVHESVSLMHSMPPDVTEEELIALGESLVNGTPLPPGFEEIGTLGKVRAVLTGVQTQSPPEQMVSVTVQDDTEDLDEAWLYLDSQLLFHATRQNGGVIDRSDHSIAMLSGFVPKSGDFAVRVEWIGASGQLLVAEHVIVGL